MGAGTIADGRLLVGDVELEVFHQGAGHALLLLHGAEGLDHKAPFLRMLARDFEVIAPSHPGFGRSDLPGRFDSVDDLAYLYLDLIEQLEVRGLVLAGFSFGGWIAAEVAIRCAHRLDRLILVSPVGIKIGARETRDIPDIFALSPEQVHKLAFHTPVTGAADYSSLTDDELRIMVRNRETLALYTWDRLEMGFVRGVPYEISAVNSSPVRMSERFWEAHDLIMKALTTHDGPFNWEGRYFHHRQVNIWPRPYQEPNPPVWITSLSPGSVGPIADRKYVVGTFLTGFDGSKAIFNAYRERAQQNGWEAANDRFAYAALVYVGESNEEGFAGARKLMWYIESNRVAPQFINPPGYVPVEAAAKALRSGGSLYRYAKPNLENLIAQGVVCAGNPDTVFRQIKKLYDYNGGFGHLLVMGQAGFLDHAETVKGIDMLAKELYPRLKELT